jgi:hypothetical protein
MDGTGVMAVAGISAVYAAADHDQMSTLVGLLVAAAGAIELHGAGLVDHAQTRGMRWLVLSQLYLMAVIFGFVALQMRTGDGFASLVPDDLVHQAGSLYGISADVLRRSLSVDIAAILAVATLIYQGGMAIYYFRRRSAVNAALRED